MSLAMMLTLSLMVATPCSFIKQHYGRKHYATHEVPTAFSKPLKVYRITA
jgi:hypothetical protein